MAISVSRLQGLLAETPQFRSRVQSVLCTQAGVVLTEVTASGDHAARAAYAKLVLSNPPFFAGQAAAQVATGANVTAATITMEDEGPRCGVSDAALLAQVAGDWNKLAGLDKGT